MKEPDDKSIDVGRFLEGMRQVPSVVTVVTTGNANGIWGITIGSFVSLSIDPPLICFNVQHKAEIHDHIVTAEEYVVHVLRENQTELSDLFARSALTEAEYFGRLDFELTDRGTPVIRDCLVTFFCRPFDALPGRDHTILIGRVTDVRHGAPGQPVVYLQRAYYGVGAYVSDHDGGGAESVSPASPVPKNAKS